jgi:hypothetical protein
METRRSRSMERLSRDDSALDRISDLLGRLVTTQAPTTRREKFKAPEFDGTGDVAYFLRQFTDVTQANEWNPAATLLHIREALKGTAQACGNAETLEGVYNALRARFGLSVREARSKLSTLKREPRTTLQEHATEVTRLMNVAYAELPLEHRQRMTLDMFQGTLGNAYLQRHLLAVDARTLEDTVRAGSEFLQIKPTSFPNSQVHIVEEDVQEPDVQVVQANPLDTLMKMMQSLTTEVSALKKAQNQQSIPIPEVIRKPDRARRNPPGISNVPYTTTSPTVCWGCRQPGHARKACPVNPWETSRQQMSGNAHGPQQL